MASDRILTIASIIQGEAGSTSGQFAVAAVMYNRMQTSGFPSDAYGVATQSGQFVGYNSNPSVNAIALATALDSGQPPPGGSTGNALNFVSAANGPATSAMVANGTDIGGNYFSDKFGTPTSNFVAPQYSGGNVPGRSGVPVTQKADTGSSPTSSGGGGGSGGSDVIPSKASSICQGIAENPLNPYILTQYYITFGVLPINTKLSSTGTTTNSAPIGSSKLASASAATSTINSSSNNKYVLASTGGINDSGSKQSYYNIVKLSMDTILTPTEGNPVVSQQIKMRLTLQEPYGFHFIEDMIDMAKKCGYQNSGVGVVDYFVRINFGGYDPNSGKWVYPIPFIANKKITQVEYSVAIADVHAQTNAEGTLYDFDLVFSDHYGYLMREMVVMPSTLTGLSGSGTFGGFCDKLAIALRQNKAERTDQKITRNYIFKYPKELGNSPFNGSGFQEALKSEGEQGSSPINLPTGKTDVLQIIKMALSNVTYSQDKFLYPKGGKHDPTFTTPIQDHTIRFIYSRGAFDDKLQTFNNNTITYIIEPFTTYSKYSPVPEDLGAYTDPSNQAKRMQDIQKRGMWVRTYNYLFTGQNTEVLNFDAMLTMFYNEALNVFIRGGPNGDTKPLAANGLTPGAANNTPTTKPTGLAAAWQSITRLFGGSSAAKDAGSIIAQAANNSTSTGGNTTGINSTGASRLQGGIDETVPTDHGGSGNEASPQRDHFAYEIAKTNYLKYDMMALNNFEVKGDPIWLLSAYGSEDLDQSGGIKMVTSPVERLGRIIFIRIFAPDQTSYMNPDFIKSGKTNTQNGAFMGGFYQISTVRNTFANGQFTQSLQGTKMNHLNYITELASQTSSTNALMQKVNGLAKSLPQTTQAATPSTTSAPVPSSGDFNNLGLPGVGG